MMINIGIALAVAVIMLGLIVAIASGQEMSLYLGLVPDTMEISRPTIPTLLD